MGDERDLHPPLRISMTSNKRSIFSNIRSTTEWYEWPFLPDLTGMKIDEALDVNRFYDKIVL